MTTITSGSTIGIALSSASYTNLVVVNAGVSISSATLAIMADLGSWTVGNYGSLGGTGTYGIGVALYSGGSVVNDVSGAISGGDDGIEIAGSTGEVANSGTIIGLGLGTRSSTNNIRGYGVELAGGGTVTNAGSAFITGGDAGVYVTGATGTVINAGTIAGSSGTQTFGVVLSAGGSVNNTIAATISGSYAGVGMSSGTLDNAGSISAGADAVGVFAGPGTVVNSGAIYATGTAGRGISMAAGGTVTNSGMIGGGAVGVGLSGGGVTNQPGGTISGTSDAISISIAGGTVVNAGRLAATSKSGEGVALLGPGVVSNQSSGTIAGGKYGAAVYLGNASDTVVNYGAIIGNAQGVSMGGAGTVLNFGSIVASGGFPAVAGAGTVVNSGLIAGLGQVYGQEAVLSTGGRITNTSDGTISGGISSFNGYVLNAGTLSGVNLLNGGTISNVAGGAIGSVLITYKSPGWTLGTVVNAGRVGGTSGYGVAANFSSVPGTVSNAASGYILGVDLSSGTVVNYGTIAGAAGGGTVSVMLASGGVVSNAASGVLLQGVSELYGLVVNRGRIAGEVVNAAGGTVLNDGTIGAGGTAVAFFGTQTSSNYLVLQPGFAFSGLVAGAAQNTLANILELASAAATGTVTGLGTSITNFGQIEFDAGARWFVAGNSASLAGFIGGFAPGDTIEMTGVTVSASNFSAGAVSVLSLYWPSGGANLNLVGSLAATNFHVSNVASGALVTVSCFAEGTRLLTARGEVAVEALRVGEMLATQRSFAPVRWIGHRRVDCRRHARPWDVLPVRVLAGAFGRGVPAREVRLSPDHAVFVDGVLIPIRYLINGRTVVQEQVTEIIYYHVELPAHDVIFAEGLPCESYLDTGNRSGFVNGGPAASLHPGFAHVGADTYAA